MTKEEFAKLFEEDTEFKGYVQEAIKSPLAGLTDDTAHNFIESNPVLKKYRDSFTTKGIKSYGENQIPGLIKDAVTKREQEVRQELNPKETPTQREMRELKELIKNMETDKKDQATKEDLRAFAKEVGYDQVLAEDFLPHGLDKGKEIIQAHMESRKTGIDSGVNDRLTPGKREVSTMQSGDGQTGIWPTDPSDPRWNDLFLEAKESQNNAKYEETMKQWEKSSQKEQEKNKPIIPGRM